MTHRADPLPVGYKARRAAYRRCAEAGISIDATAHIAGLQSRANLQLHARKDNLEWRKPPPNCPIDRMLLELPYEVCRDVFTLIAVGEYQPLEAVRIATAPKRRITFKPSTARPERMIA